MKLIADSDSTRAEWALVKDSSVIQRVFSEGINPFFQNRRDISRIVRLNLPEVFFKRKIGWVYFYGAGCGTKSKRDTVLASLMTQFRVPVTIESDLLGAARGLFKRESGIVCMLGTGSNSCLYDGEEIVKNVRPAGYVLGDEGGEATLGKLFLADALKDLAPAGLILDFYDKFGITPEKVLEFVYTDSSPNRFLATASYFLSEYMADDYVYGLYKQNVRSFFGRCVCQYKYNDYPVRFVGSFAYRHSEIVEEVAREYGISIDSIHESPIPGLVEYHAALP